jgi:hypothetical protein
MQKKPLLFAALVASGIFFMGNSTGPAAAGNGDRTGSPVSSLTCGAAGCHSGGTFSPSITIRVLDAQNNAVTTYTPGQTYTIEVNIASTSASGFGFQATALFAGNAMAGSFGNPGAGKQVTTLGTRSYVEHSARATSGLFSFPWTAPTAGGGTVTVYAAGIAANGNGTTSGDSPVNGSLSLTEATGTSIDQNEATSFSLFPNPTSNQINIQAQSQGQERLRIYNSMGQVLLDEILEVNPGQIITRSLDQLPTGIYTLELGKQSQLFVKK